MMIKTRTQVRIALTARGSGLYSRLLSIKCQDRRHIRPRSEVCHVTPSGCSNVGPEPTYSSLLPSGKRVAVACRTRQVKVRIHIQRFAMDAFHAHPIPCLPLEPELHGGLGVLNPDSFPPELGGMLTHLMLIFKYANGVRS